MPQILLMGMGIFSNVSSLYLEQFSIFFDATTCSALDLWVSCRSMVGMENFCQVTQLIVKITSSMC